jgi:hypothetical protein
MRPAWGISNSYRDQNTKKADICPLCGAALLVRWDQPTIVAGLVLSIFATPVMPHFLIRLMKARSLYVLCFSVMMNYRFRDLFPFDSFTI